MRDEDRGAAALEFALVLPVLLTLVMGVAEFGFAFLTQSSLAGAARETARSFAIHGDAVQARSAGLSAAGATGLTAGQIAISPAACPVSTAAGAADVMVQVTINYPYTGITGFFGSWTMTAEGTMRCNG